MMARLVLPEKKYFDSYLSALVEHRDTISAPRDIKHFQMEIDNFPTYVINNLKKELTGALPQRTYWLVDGDEYIGTVQLRLLASARYPNIKSNIYYDVRPSKRRLGYGTLALALVTEKARILGLDRLIITCDSLNLPSKKIIERAGAELIGVENVPDRKEPVLMYKLDLK